jgi:hypothetical protein
MARALQAVDRMRRSRRHANARENGLGIVTDVEGDARRAVREAEPWLIWFGRFGFAAKGVVYTLIGVLAMLAAVGAGGDTAGKKRVLAYVADAPYGRYLLAAIGIGILGYALWRFIQAAADTENKGSGGKGIAVRIGYFGIGLLYVGLSISAFALLAGTGSAGDDGQAGWTARLMSQPFGRWLVGVAGAMVMAYGARQIYRAYTLKFMRKLTARKMSAAEEKWACRLGRTGYAARGIVFGIIGLFLILAAVHADPGEARGLSGALDALARQPWGSAVLGAVALGLTAYGLYMFVEARYRRMVIT